MEENNSYAIIESGGKQHRVIAGQKLLVEKLDGEPGSVFDIKEVLLLKAGEESVIVGQPYVQGAVVKAKILSEQKEKKVIVFKKRKRKGYKKKQGHRQGKTQILIEEILAHG